MTVQVCTNCQKTNPADASYCYSCGHILPFGLQTLHTHDLQDASALKPQIRWGTAYFGERNILRLRVRDSGEVLTVAFRQECVLGRAVGDKTPHVDLTPFGAVELGVSRLHAKLTRESTTIMVQDLGSVNGTFLNGMQLIPHQPRVLRNEDELCLGQLVLRISFLHEPSSSE